MKYLLSIFLFFLALAGFAQTVPQVNNVPWYEFTRKLSVGQRFAPPRDTLSYPPGAINRDTTGLLAFASNGNLYKLWNGTWSLIGGSGSDVEIIGDSAIVVGDDTLFVKNTVVETDLDPSYAMQDGDTVRLYFRQYAMDSLYIRHNGDTLFMPNGDTLYLNRIASTGYAITGNGTSGNPLALDTSQLYDASASNRGIVSLGDQVMGKGRKTFDSIAVAPAGYNLWSMSGIAGSMFTSGIVWDEVKSEHLIGTERQFVTNGNVDLILGGSGVTIFPRGYPKSAYMVSGGARLPSINPALRIRDKAGVSLSVGTTAERPSANLDTGTIRYNTDSSRFEGYVGGYEWKSLAWLSDATGGGGSGTVTSITAGLGLTGGTITGSGTIGVDTAALSGAYIKNQYASKESKDAYFERSKTDTSFSTNFRVFNSQNSTYTNGLSNADSSLNIGSTAFRWHNISDALSIYRTVGASSMAMITYPTLNSITNPDMDIIFSANTSQANVISGVSNLRGIWGGYDNYIGDNIASNIFGSHHSRIDGATSGHAVISGGSYDTLAGGGFSYMASGRYNRMDGLYSFTGGGQQLKSKGAYNVLLSGNGNQVVDAAANYVFIGPALNGRVETGSGNAFTFIGTGNAPIASGTYSIVLGGLNDTASGTRSMVLNGNGNRAAGQESTVINGVNNRANGTRSIILNGTGNFAPSFAEVTLGNYATTYTRTSATGMSGDDRILTVGIGTSDGARRDAMVIKKNGEVKLGSPYTVTAATDSINFLVTDSNFAFAPTSASRYMTWADISWTINQTGTANGPIRWLYYRPKLTSILGPHIAIENTAGNNLFNSTSGSTGIGVSSVAASAKLEVASTTQGFLPPRMTGAQAEAISSPAEGLMVYATDGSGTTITSKGWWGYDGSTWVKLN